MSVLLFCNKTVISKQFFQTQCPLRNQALRYSESEERLLVDVLNIIAPLHNDFLKRYRGSKFDTHAWNITSCHCVSKRPAGLLIWFRSGNIFIYKHHLIRRCSVPQRNGTGNKFERLLGNIS